MQKLAQKLPFSPQNSPFCDGCTSRLALATITVCKEKLLFRLSNPPCVLVFSVYLCGARCVVYRYNQYHNRKNGFVV